MTATKTKARLRALGPCALSLPAPLQATLLLFVLLGCGAQAGAPSAPSADESGAESPSGPSEADGTKGKGAAAQDRPAPGIRHEAPPVLAVTPRQGNKSPGGIPGHTEPDEVDAPVVNNPTDNPEPSPTDNPVHDPVTHPNRIALDFQLTTGEPLATIDLKTQEPATKDVTWHGILSARNGEKDDTDLWLRFAPFFLQHVIVYGNGEANEARARKWVSDFIGKGEFVSLVASKKNDKKLGKAFETELAALISKHEAVLALAPFEDDESLGRVSVSTFDALLTRWTHAEFASLTTDDVYVDLRPRADDDGVLGAFLTQASAFLPSGRFVPLIWTHDNLEAGEENKDVTVAGLLREGVLHAVVRNESALCRPLEAHLLRELGTKESEALRLVPGLDSAPATLLPYIKGSDCVPQGGLLLIRARL